LNVSDGDAVEFKALLERGGSSVSICVGCGLCCDGTLLSHLAVSDESDLGAPLRTLGVEIIVAADPPVFELPCPAVEQGTCTIHHLHRPHACAQFECALSQAVLDGNLPSAQAREVIATTLEIRSAVSDGRRSRADLENALDEHFRGTITR
jgi:Fe-S-cluster containining protein